MLKVKPKTAKFAIALILIMSMSASIMLFPTANAHTPKWNVPTYAYISVAPDPVGVGQSATVVVWVDKMPAGAAIGNNIRFHDYKLTITAPDGQNQTVTWPIVTDTTSSANTVFTPDQTGTYTLTFEFPEQTYTWTEDLPQFFGPPLPNEYTNDTYLASKATTTLTVQTEQVAKIPEYPLPVDYWSRPIEGQNTQWASIASNYLNPFGPAFSSGSSRYQPDGAAPGSSHVMWVKPIQFGGVVGGSNVGTQGNTFYTGLSYEARFSTPIIMYGRLYYSLPRSDSSAASFMGTYDNGYVCVDLQTGQQIWWKNYSGVNPTFGQFLDYQSPNQHGVIPNGYLWATSGYGPYTWTAYDPLDGNWLFTYTNVPAGTNVYGPNGEILRYVLDTTHNWLALWNSTVVLPAYSFGSEGYRPVGQTLDASKAYSWNVTIPALTAGTTILKAIPEDIMLCSTPTQTGMGSTGTNTVNVAAISLKPSSRGSVLWSKTFDPPSGNITRMFGPVDENTRVFTMSDKETLQWLGFNLDTGNKIWGPVGHARDFNYYATVGSGGVSQTGFAAYGKLYSGGYGGELLCYDLKNGSLLWKYNNTNSGLETPYGLYPLFPGAIADDKIYLYNNEHSPETPMYKGAKVYCVNATTGEEIFTMLSWGGVGTFADEGWPVADGYIAYLNAYDMQLYCLGKGPSAMTVEAPANAAKLGDSLIIRGTVTDIAAGTKLDQQATRFPNGVPAVSDASMSAWMEYVYMQKPRPTNATGVPVTLSVLDANGNYRNIGVTTSNADGFFTYNWQPDIQGQYTVYASFGGSESYWPSHAVTSFAVDPAAATPTAQPTQPASMADLYFVPATIGLFVAVIVVGLLIILVLRKRA